MSKITEFNKPTLRTLRVDIDMALAAVAATHGISITAGNASFRDSNATFKLECALLNSDGKSESKELVCLRECYPELVNKQITLELEGVGKIVGYNPRAHQYPFLIQTAKGIYKITARKAGLPELY